MSAGDEPSVRGGGAPASAGASSATGSEGLLEPVPLPPLVDDPLVSVLIPNKDYGRFLGDALDGLIAQTYERWEAVVCDDGSTDDSRSVVAGYADRDPRVRFVTHDRTRGQAAAFNSAFREARGEVIAFLDSDDVPAPSRLEATVQALRRTGAGLAVHALTLTDGVGTPIQRIPAFTRFERGWLGERVVRRGGRWRWVPTSGVALRREIADLVFPMPEEGYPSSADTYFLVLAPLLTEVAAIDETHGSYRRHGANQFARAGMDVARIPRTMDNLVLSATRVNERLDELARPGRRLRVKDNLRYRELGYQQALFSGVRRSALWGRYRVLVSALMADDLYGGVQKVWAPVLYGVAIALPRSARGPWLSVSLSASKPKELVRRILTARGGRAGR